MELQWKESRKILRKGRATLLLHTELPHSQECAEQIIACYEQSAQAIETYATNTLLPKLEMELAEAPRQNRLHWKMPTLSLLCRGELVKDRWLSIVLTLQRDEQEQSLREYRVWDCQTGQLCPLEFFVPRKIARGYHRWSFFFKDDIVWGINLRKVGNDSGRDHKAIGKMKELPGHY